MEPNHKLEKFFSKVITVTTRVHGSTFGFQRDAPNGGFFELSKNQARPLSCCRDSARRLLRLGRKSTESHLKSVSGHNISLRVYFCAQSRASRKREGSASWVSLLSLICSRVLGE